MAALPMVEVIDGASGNLGSDSHPMLGKWGSLHIAMTLFPTELPKERYPVIATRM